MISLLLIALCGAPVAADVTLPAVFNDHMVLQREKPLAFWGWAEPGESVTVALLNQEGKAKTDADGKWSLKLDAMKEGGPYKIKFQGKNSIELQDVMVGEVWLCSGQSNMEWSMSAVNNAGEEIAAADFPNIRLFHVPKVPAEKPRQDVNAKWVTCAPSTVRGFSAVSYFFGRKLHRELNIPIGLIASSWGGTRIEPWTPPEGFAAVESLKDFLQPDPNREERFREMQRAFLASVRKKMVEHLPKPKKKLDDDLEFEEEENDDLAGLIPQPKDPQLGNARRFEKWLPIAEKALEANKPLPKLKGEWPRGWPILPPTSSVGAGTPTALYNGMIYALIPFSLRGAIWYQGESNLHDGIVYHEKKKALVRGWRKVWNDETISFYYTQLAPYRYGNSNPELLARIWEAQAKSLEIPRTGMAVTTDIGNTRDIHPRNKQDVGKRLALWALAKNYGKDVVYSGPLYESMKVEGDKARISFHHAESGLAVRGGGDLTHFQVAGADKQFKEAKAVIDGSTVVVSADGVTPVAVRFGWHHEAEPNLSNKAGLPASPFRTDDWPLAQ